MDAPNWFPLELYNFLINKAPRTFLLQNMDSLWKIWTISHRWKKNLGPEHISLAKFGPVASFCGFWKLLRQVSSAAHNVLKPHSRWNCTLHSFPCTLRKFWERCVRPTVAYWWKPVIHFSRYATVDTTNALSSYFMTIDMHRFAFMAGLQWEQIFQSGSKYFRKICSWGNQIGGGGPN